MADSRVSVYTIRGFLAKVTANDSPSIHDEARDWLLRDSTASRTEFISEVSSKTTSKIDLPVDASMTASPLQLSLCCAGRYIFLVESIIASCRAASLPGRRLLR